MSLLTISYAGAYVPLISHSYLVASLMDCLDTIDAQASISGAQPCTGLNEQTVDPFDSPSDRV